MKKVILLFVCLFTMQFVAHADNDKPIQIGQLPKTAQEFIQKYFSTDSVSYAKMETEFVDKSYDVIFTNGSKVEFDKRGEWKEVDCKRKVVPAGIVPEAIEKHIKMTHVGQQVTKIERNKQGYEAKLSNGMELKYDKKGNFKNYDL